MNIDNETILYFTDIQEEVIAMVLCVPSDVTLHSTNNQTMMISFV